MDKLWRPRLDFVGDRVWGGSKKTKFKVEVSDQAVYIHSPVVLRPVIREGMGLGSRDLEPWD